MRAGADPYGKVVMLFFKNQIKHIGLRSQLLIFYSCRLNGPCLTHSFLTGESGYMPIIFMCSHTNTGTYVYRVNTAQQLSTFTSLLPSCKASLFQFMLGVVRKMTLLLLLLLRLSLRGVKCRKGAWQAQIRGVQSSCQYRKGNVGPSIGFREEMPFSVSLSFRWPSPVTLGLHTGSVSALGY